MPVAAMADDIQRPGPRPVPVGLVLVLLFVVYNANLRVIHIDDSVPARLLPFALLVDHTWYLDRWVEPYVRGASGPYGVYFVTRSRGHWVSAYPLLTPLLVTPLYVPPAVWLAHAPPALRYDSLLVAALSDVMEKLSASLLAVTSAGLLYLALCRVADQNTSLLLTAIYGLASSTWSISSQALWRQDVGELSFAFLLWALGRDPASPGYSFGVGVSLAAACANSPPDAVVVLPLAVYFLLRSKRQAALFLLPLAVTGTLVFAYNSYFFGNPFGAYPAFIQASHHAAGFFIRTSWRDAFAGLLVSPSRGLFIYMPWTVLAVWGMVRAWRRNLFGWGRYVLAGVALVFLGYVRYSSWWGGWCFGPRYLTSLLPLFVFFLLPVLPSVRASTWLRFALTASVAAAVWIEVVGAFYYGPKLTWDATPVSVDRDPSRLWNWSDTQIARSWKVGPAPPNLVQQIHLIRLICREGKKEPGRSATARR